MQALKKNAKFMGITALSFTGIYLIYKRRLSKTKATRASEVLPESEKDALIKGLRVTYNGQMLSADTVLDIAMTLSKFSAAACHNLTHENIKVRRAHKDNLIKYAQSCKEAITNVQEATAQAGKEVHDRLGISEEVWARSFGYYLQQGHPKFKNIHATTNQAQLEVVPPKISREISKEEVINMMTKMTEAYKAEFANIPFLNAQFRDPDLTGVVISYRATDAVYEKLQIETDDFNSAAQKYIPKFGVDEKKIYQEFIKMTQSAKIAPHQAMRGTQGNRFY